MEDVILATHNAGKVDELSAMLLEAGYRLHLPSDFGVDFDVEETGSNYWENAYLKAASLAHAGLPVLADDTGLSVFYLGGAPGLHTARFAGPDATDAENRALLLGRLGSIPDKLRHAQFICTLCYLPVGKHPIYATGRRFGLISREERGNLGFGYDALFMLPEMGKTMAEIPVEVKNRISHRGKALEKLLHRLKEGAACE
jgi:XTP/dITP diphosphohydrolase